MRDIKQIYHSFFRGTSWIYGPSVPSTVPFSSGLRPSENSTVEGTSEPIDSTSASQEWYICLLYYPGPAGPGDMNHKLRLIANCTQFAIELRWISFVRLIALLLCSAATVLAWCRMRMPNACWNAPSPTPLLCVHISCVYLNIEKKNCWHAFDTSHLLQNLSLLCMYVLPIMQTK